MAVVRFDIHNKQTDCSNDAAWKASLLHIPSSFTPMAIGEVPWPLWGRRIRPWPTRDAIKTIHAGSPWLDAGDTSESPGTGR